MANLNFVDQPTNTVQSVYSPIKFTARVDSTDRAKYPSCKVSIIPRNLDDSLDSSGRIDIRVQPSINVPNFNSTSNTPNNNFIYYTIDVSSILRDFVSYDLRPCTHDTTTNVRRDISLGQLSLNTYKRFKVEFFLEEIINGVLTTSSTESEIDDANITAVNSALLHEEEHFLAIGNELLDGTSAQSQGNLLDVLYKHSCDDAYEQNRQKYLTTKPVNHRIIGHDECEYLSFIIHDNDSDHVRSKIRFRDINGSSIKNSAGNDCVLTIDRTTDGQGNLGDELNTLGDVTSGFLKPTVSVVQIGVGTRNIKETARSRFFNDEGFTDFSNVGSYIVYTEDSSSNRIGEDITYHIDHTRSRVNGVRFHWQNRLGGIDSYTFDGAFTEGINISSKSYEQSIYPQFRGQLGNSTANTTVLRGDLQFYAEDYGATVSRVAGLTDDKYQSVRKSKVKAVKEGTAISRPYGIAEQDMFEDLLASPNVWIEKGWTGKEVFREDWSGYAATSNIADNWNLVEGSFTTDASFNTADGHITGTRTYKKGNNSGNDTLWASSKKFIRYNPKSLYEIEVRIKSSGNGSGGDFVGFTGYDSDQTTIINTSGLNNFGNAHYITLEDFDQTAGDEFETFRGYVTGHSSAATVGDQANNINAPSSAYTGIDFISPMFLLHHDDVEGITQIDYIVVREYQTDIPNSRGWYSTLNRNYHVPVVIKDASVTTFDNENLQRCTLNYIESKAKRTIE
tara:strand:- start:6258 stop:8456 length:2199 start_codon:yes stop_codon:yes gene_type:complete